MVRYPSEVWMNPATNPSSREYSMPIKITTACIGSMLKAFQATLEESLSDDGYDLKVLTALTITQLKELIEKLKSWMREIESRHESKRD